MAFFFDNTSEILIAQANATDNVKTNEAASATTSVEEPAPKEHHVPAINFYIYGLISISIFVILAFISTRKLTIRPGKLQNIFEYIVEMLYSIPTMVMGERGLKYAPFISTFFVAIICMNMIGLVPGFKSASANLSVTLALSLTAFVAIQYFGIKEKGWRYIRHFMGPVVWLAPLMFVIEIISELVRPLSLAMRLYGNIFGEEQVVEVVSHLGHLGPVVLGPVIIQLMLPLQLLSVFLQAFVFTLLVSVYISMATEKEEH